MVNQAENKRVRIDKVSESVGTYRPRSVSPATTGARVFGAIPTEVFANRKSFIETSRKGIPGQWVKSVIEVTGLREMFLSLLGVSSGNLSRVYRRKALPKETSEEVLDAVRLLQQAESVWESHELAIQWLDSPVPALGGERPINLFDTFEGRRWVAQVLSKIEHGDFS